MRKNLNVILAYTIMLGLIILVGDFSIMECCTIDFKYVFNFSCHDNGCKYSVGICGID